MARYDEDQADPWENIRKKLLRRWEDYFINKLPASITSAHNVSNEELQIIFCDKFKYAVELTIKFKEEKVMEGYPLSYLFYSIFRGF